MENAADFYGNVLGLPELGKSKGGLLFDAGGNTIALYESGTAGTGQATCLWWKVDDVAKTVRALKKRGVTFDTNYDLAFAEKDGDIYLLDEEMRAAWFRDIDGNILGIGNF
jgi:catechol 2,3-dioxygenase-like lactoylglutathione lyase family enzyme